MHIEKRSLLRDERGLSTVEYTVLLVLIVAIAVGLWQSFGETISGKLSESDTLLDTTLEVPDP
jgi:Flp pilus assembly pilin Flp